MEGASDKKNLKRKAKLLSKTGDFDEILSTWTQCCFFLKNKNRYCNIGRTPNSKFCGNHQSNDNEAVFTSRVRKQAGFNIEISRVPCPLDPSHTVFSHKLQSHLKICNVNIRNMRMIKEVYYCENCNSGSNIASLDEEVNVDDLAIKIRDVYDKVVRPNVHKSYMVDLGDSVECIISSTIGKATAFSRTRHAEQDVRIIEQMVGCGLFDHNQDSRIPVETAVPRDLTVIELGAGKGMLGLAINSLYPDAKLVLVERNGLRHKADKVLREKNIAFQRVRMDIRHCLLSKLPGIVPVDIEKEMNKNIQKDVILTAKHLCGLATDISIRSAACFSDVSDGGLHVAGEDDSTSAPKLRGMAIATCCHHACSWSDYAGADWFLNNGFTAAEFHLMKSWSGWAHTLNVPDILLQGGIDASGTDMLLQEGTDISSVRVDDVKSMEHISRSLKVDASSKLSKESEGEGGEEGEDDEEGEGGGEGEFEEILHNVPAMTTQCPRPANISTCEMAAIGKMIKRIFDEGRVYYLQSLGLCAYQVQYCDPSFSPECYMILATRK